MTAVSKQQSTSDREMVFTRVYDAPRELVFRMWTELYHLEKWWGPNGFTTTTREFELKPEGVWRFVMHGPDGMDYQNKITFLKIDNPERLVYRHDGGEGELESVEFQVTVEFVDKGGKTELTMRSVFKTAEMMKLVTEKYGAREGAVQHLARLDKHVTMMAGEQPEFVISRVLNAPRELVFKVWTECEHLTKWFGPKGFPMTFCRVDLRPGGVFHYRLEAPNGGGEMWGKFVYREVVAPERLVYVNSFSDAECGITRHPFAPDWPLEGLNTLTLEKRDGKTKLTIRSIAINATEKERAIFANSFKDMRQGWGGTFEQLEAHLAEQ